METEMKRRTARITTTNAHDPKSEEKKFKFTAFTATQLAIVMTKIIKIMK